MVLRPCVLAPGPGRRHDLLNEGHLRRVRSRRDRPQIKILRALRVRGQETEGAERSENQDGAKEPPEK